MDFGLKIIKNVEGVGILVIDTWPKWRFEIWQFLWFFGDQSGKFESKLLLIRFYNKFEIHISKNITRIANF